MIQDDGPHEEKDRSNAWKEMEKSIEIHGMLFDSLDYGIILMDKEFRVVFANSWILNFKKMDSSLIGKDCSHVHPEDHSGKDGCPCRVVMKTGSPHTYSKEFIIPDEKKSFLEMTTYSINDDYGNLCGFLEQTVDVTDKKKMEMELKENKKRLQMAIEGGDLGLWDWNIPTGKVIFNHKWADMLGYDPGDIEPKVSSWSDLVHPDDLPKVMVELDAHLEGKTDLYETEHRMRTKSGKWKWILDRGKVFERDNRGKPLRALGAHLDIDERKRMEKELKDSEELFKTLFEQAAVGVAQVNPDGTFVMVNSKFSDIVGYSKEELKNTSFRDITHPEDLDLDEDQINRIVQGEIDSFEIDKRYIRKDGEIVWIKLSSNCVRDENGKLKYAIAVITDITPLKKADSRLIESEKKYRILAETTPDITLLHDMKGRITYLNRAAKEFTGIDSKRAVGESVEKFIPREDANKLEKRKEKRISGDRNTRKYETEILDYRGNLIPFEINSAPVVSNGEIKEILIVARDITDRKMAEERIRKEKESAEFYLDLLNHDIGNVHQGIQGSLQLLENKLGDDDVTKKVPLDLAKRAIGKANVLSRDVMVLSQIRRRERTFKDLDLEDEIIKALDQIKGAFPERDIRTDLELMEFRIPAEQLIRQIFFNLFHNGVKLQGIDAWLGVTMEKIGNGVRIEISDRGPGIPDGDKVNLFTKKGVKNKGTRTGLGLIIVKELVQRYNGTIRVEDRIKEDKAQGTKFIIEFRK